MGVPRRALLATGALLLAFGGCRREPTCAEVADHVLGLPRPEGLSVADRETILRNCERELGPDDRACYMQARDLGEAKRCELEAAFRALEAERDAR